MAQDLLDALPDDGAPRIIVQGLLERGDDRRSPPQQRAPRHFPHMEIVEISGWIRPLLVGQEVDQGWNDRRAFDNGAG
jgi:hypothetical protein